jgi:SAM-dependent methyltransferase
MKTKPFDFKNTSDFDRHIDLSIPNYSTLDSIFSNIALEFAQAEGAVVDLGCSTGRFLHSLPKIEQARYIGIDEVEMAQFNSFDLIIGDCEEYLPDIENVTVIVSMFFLQFLGKYKRQRVLAQIKDHIERGATFLVAEKVYLNDARLQNLIHRMHIQSKRESFDDKEILDKDKQLSISMFCKTETELNNELNQLGNVTKVWQSYNFLGYVIQSF